METTIADKFLTPEYNKFVELVKKSGGESTLQVINNRVVYGSSKAVVPTFRSVEDVKADLETRKVSLLLKVNDLYEKIITSDEPELYKSKYQSVVSQVQQIDMLIDEMDAYIANINEQKVTMPIAEAQAKLSSNKSNVQEVVNAIGGDVHVGKKNVKKLVGLHKDGVKLEADFAEAKSMGSMDYIIWEHKEDDDKDTTTHNMLSYLPSSTKTSTSSKRLSVAKKAVIKKATKKVMLQKLA